MFWVQLLIFTLVLGILLYWILKPIKREEIIDIIRPPKMYDAFNQVIREEDIQRKKYIYSRYNNRVPEECNLKNVYVPQIGKGYELESNLVKNKHKKIDEYKPKRTEN